MDKKNDALFRAEYVKISNIEWVDEDDSFLCCFPTQMEFDDGFLIELPKNYLELSNNAQNEILRDRIEDYLDSLFPDAWPYDFDTKVYGLSIENTDEDDEDLKDIKPYEPVCHLEALLNLDSIKDDIGNEFVLLPKDCLLVVINSRKFNQ